MSKDLTVKDQEFDLDFSVFNGRSEGDSLTDLNESDIKMPKVKILQSNSVALKELLKAGEKAKPGQLYNTDSGEYSDSIDCVVLFQGKSMIMWNEKYKKDDEPLCRSYDGKVKAPGVEGCGDGNCLTCKYSSQNPRVWASIKKDPDKTKPPCNMSYSFLAQNAKTEELFSFMASGASVKEAKEFMGKLFRKNLEPIAVEFTLTTEAKETDRGDFFILKFTNLRVNKKAIDPKVYAELKQAALNYKDQYMSRVIQNDIIDVDQSEIVSEDSEASTMF